MRRRAGGQRTRRVADRPEPGTTRRGRRGKHLLRRRHRLRDLDQGGIHAREYQLYLPSKEELQQKLTEWTREQDE